MPDRGGEARFVTGFFVGVDIDSRWKRGSNPAAPPVVDTDLFLRATI